MKKHLHSDYHHGSLVTSEESKLLVSELNAHGVRSMHST